MTAAPAKRPSKNPGRKPARPIPASYRALAVKTVQDSLEAKPERGRETKLNPLTQKIIMKAIREGATITDACEAAGITTKTYETWKSRGRDEPGSIYETFVQQLEVAFVKAKLKLVANIYKAGATEKRQWRAAAHLLARRYPQEYGEQPQNLIITHANEKRPLDHMTNAELAAYRANVQREIESYAAELRELEGEEKAADAAQDAAQDRAFAQVLPKAEAAEGPRDIPPEEGRPG